MRRGAWRWFTEERPYTLQRWFWFLIWFSVATSAFRAIYFFVGAFQ